MSVEEYLEQFYTEEEMAKLRRRSLSGLRSDRSRHKDDGEHPPFIKDGNLILYPKTEFVAWNKTRMHGGTSSTNLLRRLK